MAKARKKLQARVKLRLKPGYQLQGPYPPSQSEIGTRAFAFDGKQIRYYGPSIALSYYENLLVQRQDSLSLAQYMCNMTHERLMGGVSELAPIFDWMEKFLTIAASKRFPEMPATPHDAAMWGLFNHDDQLAFSAYGINKATVQTVVEVTGAMQPTQLYHISTPLFQSYEAAFRNNPDENLAWDLTVSQISANKSALKYPARNIAIQWMMEAVGWILQEVVKLVDGDVPPTTFITDAPELARVKKQIKLLREEISVVEECYTALIDYIRNSGQLGVRFSAKLAGIVEAPQERRPPPLLEH